MKVGLCSIFNQMAVLMTMVLLTISESIGMRLYYNLFLDNIILYVLVFFIVIKLAGCVLTRGIPSLAFLIYLFDLAASCISAFGAYFYLKINYMNYSTYYLPILIMTLLAFVFNWFGFSIIMLLYKRINKLWICLTMLACLFGSICAILLSSLFI